MNTGCYCSLGHHSCNCGLVQPCAAAPIQTVEEESPWIWLLYAMCIVLGAALSTVFWRAE